MFLLFNIYFILLLIFVLIHKNKHVLCLFFLTRTSGLLSDPPSYVRVYPDFCKPPPTPTLASVIILYYIILYYIILYYIILYYIILYYIILYYIILYYIILYHIISYHIISYHIIYHIILLYYTGCIEKKVIEL